MFGSTFIRITCLCVNMLFCLQSLSAMEDATTSNDYLQNFADAMQHERVKYEDGKLEIFAQKMSACDIVLRACVTAFFVWAGFIVAVRGRQDGFNPIAVAGFIGLGGIFAILGLEEFYARESLTPLVLIDENGITLSGSQSLCWRDVCHVAIEKVTVRGERSSREVIHLNFFDKAGNKLMLISSDFHLPICVDDVRKVAEFFVTKYKESDEETQSDEEEVA